MLESFKQSSKKEEAAVFIDFDHNRLKKHHDKVETAAAHLPRFNLY